MPGLSDGMEFAHTSEIIGTIKAADTVDEAAQECCAMIGSGFLIGLIHIHPAVCLYVKGLNPTGWTVATPPSNGQKDRRGQTWACQSFSENEVGHSKNAEAKQGLCRTVDKKGTGMVLHYQRAGLDSVGEVVWI